MTLLGWNNKTDWDNSQSQEDVVYGNIVNTDHSDQDTVKRGYSIENPTPSNPFIYWPMHEDEEGVTYDFSGQDRNGVALYTNVNEPGLFDTTAYAFNGNNILNNKGSSLVYGGKDAPIGMKIAHTYEDNSSSGTYPDEISGYDQVDNEDSPSIVEESARGKFAVETTRSDSIVTNDRPLDPFQWGSTDGFGFGGWIYPKDWSTRSDDLTAWISYGSDGDNTFTIQTNQNVQDDNWEAFVQVQGSNAYHNTNAPIEFDKWTHVWYNIDQTYVYVYVNGNDEGRSSHGENITNFNLTAGGNAGLYLCRRASDQDLSGRQITDEVVMSKDPLEQSAIQRLVDRREK